MRSTAARKDAASALASWRSVADELPPEGLSVRSAPRFLQRSWHHCAVISRWAQAAVNEKLTTYSTNQHDDPSVRPTGMGENLPLEGAIVD